MLAGLRRRGARQRRRRGRPWPGGDRRVRPRERAQLLRGHVRLEGAAREGPLPQLDRRGNVGEHRVDRSGSERQHPRAARRAAGEAARAGDLAAPASCCPPRTKAARAPCESRSWSWRASEKPLAEARARLRRSPAASRPRAARGMLGSLWLFQVDARAPSCFPPEAIGCECRGARRVATRPEAVRGRFQSMGSTLSLVIATRYEM